jgi:hypothetical protein
MSQTNIDSNSAAAVKPGVNGAKLTRTERSGGQGQLDFKKIEAALLASSRSYLAHLLPGGEIQGHEYVVRNPTRADGEPGSFKINVKNGKWADFASGQSGRGLLDLAALICGAPLVVAAREAAAWAGIDASAPAQAADVTLEIYAEAKHLDPAFLRRLGLETAANPYAPHEKVLAMPYRNASGEPVRMRYRVAMAGKNKTVWDRQKEKGVPGLYGLDRVPDSASLMLLVEGESDCHTLWSRGHAALGVPGVMTFKAERDAAALAGLDVLMLQEPGEGGEALLKRLKALPDTSRFKVARLDGFKDVSELHCQAPERFDAVLAAAIAAAVPLTAAPQTEKKPATPRASAGQIAQAADELARLSVPEFLAAKQERATELCLSVGDLETAVKAAQKRLKREAAAEADRTASPQGQGGILLCAGERPRITDEAFSVIREDGSLFRRGKVTVCVDGEHTFEANETFIADFLERRTSFYRMKPDANGSFLRVAADAPDWLPKRITGLPGERGLHELKGIITAPTLRLDGSLIGEAGFDAATGLLLLPGKYPAIPERPTPDEMMAAWRTLWRPYAEFPYVSTVDVGVTVTAILTALVRRVLPTAPAFSIDAPCPASGKTLLATCIGLLCGGEPTVVGEAEEEEIRKRLLPVMMEDHRSVIFDNVKGTFESSALEAFLTSAYFSDRILALSKIAGFPTNVLVLFSGNNFIPGGDLWRRVLTARIDPKTEHAHLRTFDLDAQAYCRTHRQQLVAAGLTLLRGFIAAGSPRATKDKLGSYEAWDDLVRQCVIWLGDQGIAMVKISGQLAPVCDAGRAIAKAQERQPELLKLAAFLELAQRTMKQDRWRTAALIARANNELGTPEEGQPLRDTLMEIAGTGNVINSRILGRWIEKQSDRRCNGRWLERAGIRDGNTLWKICETGKEKTHLPT